MPDPSPQVRVLLAQLELQAQEKARDEATFRLDLVRAAERTVEFKVLGALQQVDQAKALIAQSDRRLRDDALAMYVNPSRAGIENLVTAQTDEESTRTVLLSVTIKNEKGARRDAVALVEARQRAVAAKQAELGAAKLRTASYQAVADAEVAVVADKRSELRDAMKLSPDWSLPIQGDSVFTPPELAAWFAQHGVASRAQAPIAQLAQAYIAEGADEHIRGDMAFAQSVLETGSFTNDDTIRFNNFAGVGHCDSCATGFQFATPDLGVRAQIQLLKDYSERGAVLKNPLVDSRLHGPSGCCQDWRALTHTWATNGNYGAKIMGVYRDMLSWLVTERGLRPLVSS